MHFIDDEGVLVTIYEPNESRGGAYLESQASLL